MIKVLLAGQLTWNIPILIVLLSFVILYAFIIIKIGKNHSIPYRQILLFILGIWLLYIAIGSPVLAISYLSFSLHMIQMSFLFFIIPPLLLLGIPHFMYKRFINILAIRKIKSVLLSPKSALITFAILFFLYHLPVMLTILSDQPIVQKGYLSLLFILSFLMWWPIAAPSPKKRLSILKKKKFAFMSGVFITPACFIFIIGALLDGMSNPFLSEMTTHFCFPSDSSTFQLLPPPFNTKYDQMMAGIFMLGLHKIGLMFTSRLTKH